MRTCPACRLLSRGVISLGSDACQAERLILGEAGEAAAPGDIDNGSRRELDFGYS